MPRIAAITLAVVLAACLWLTLAPPRALTTSRRARWVGVGLVLGTEVLLAARLNETNDGGILTYLLNVPVVLVMASALVALVDRSFSAGLQATVWALMVTCLLTFAIFVVEASRWCQIHHTSLLDGDSGGGQNLHAAIVWVLVAVPVMALPAGVIGAALGAIGPAPGRFSSVRVSICRLPPTHWYD